MHLTWSLSLRSSQSSGGVGRQFQSGLGGRIQYRENLCQVPRLSKGTTHQLRLGDQGWLSNFQVNDIGEEEVSNARPRKCMGQVTQWGIARGLGHLEVCVMAGAQTRAVADESKGLKQDLDPRLRSLSFILNSWRPLIFY